VKMFSTAESPPPPQDSGGTIQPRRKDEKATAKIVISFNKNIEKLDTMKQDDHSGSSFLYLNEHYDVSGTGATAGENPLDEELAALDLSSIEGSEKEENKVFKSLPLNREVPISDGGIVISSSVSPSQLVKPTPAAARQVVDTDEENRLASQRMKQPLQEESRDIVGAQPVADSTKDPPASTLRWSSKKRMRLGVFGVILVLIAAVVSVVIVFTRNEPVFNDVSRHSPTLTPTMIPTGEPPPPTFVQLPKPAPTTLDTGLSERTKTTAVIIGIAALSATLVGIVVYLRQRALNSR